ncbi:MAG: cell division protein ZipA C-terminal FtsZ-binding domain-containing protein [Gammaproteobacteria bacterium]
MDALRLILLLIGLAVIGVIYFYARQQQGRGLGLLQELYRKSALPGFWRRRAATEPSPPHRDTALDAADLEGLDGLVAQREPTAVDSGDLDVVVNVEAGEPLVMMLTVMARQGRLPGPALAAALRAQGFCFGDMMAFNLFAQPGQRHGPAVCTVVNVLEPGSFPDAELEGIEVPGVILILQLPGPLKPRAAFERLLESGQQLAAALGADLCDEQRNILTRQGIAHLKDKIEAYRFKQKMAQIKRRQ